MYIVLNYAPPPRHGILGPVLNIKKSLHAGTKKEYVLLVGPKIFLIFVAANTSLNAEHSITDLVSLKSIALGPAAVKPTEKLLSAVLSDLVQFLFNSVLSVNL